jgi:hypothetical protein
MRILPYQLCDLCCTLLSTFSQDCFWNDAAYEKDRNGVLKFDPTRVVVQAYSVAYHLSLEELRKSAVRGGCARMPLMCDFLLFPTISPKKSSQRKAAVC